MSAKFTMCDLENATMEELENLILDDTLTDDEMLCVLDILVERKRIESPDELPDVQAAWKRFEKEHLKPAKRIYALKRLASVAAAIVIVCTATVAAIPQARAAVIGWVREITGDAYVYRLDENAPQNTADVDVTKLRPTWVPDGYELVEDVSENGVTFVRYDGIDCNMIIYRCIPSENASAFYIDNTSGSEVESIKKTQVLNRGAEIITYYNDSNNPAIIWTDNINSLFFISGPLSEKELVKMAESIYK